MSSSQRNLATSFLAGGGTLAILGQITQVALPLGERTVAIILMFFGLFLYLLGILTARTERISVGFEKIFSKPANWLNLEVWQIPALILPILFSVLAHYAAGFDDKMFSPVGTWGAWLAGIVFFLVTLWQPNGINFRTHWKVFALALGFAALALPLRAYATGEIPIILNGDEASAGIYGMEILAGNVNNPFSVGWYAFPGMYFLIPATSISIFGNTTAALRIPSAIAGALTVGAVYLAGHTLFDKRTGILAAIVMAGFHFHIHFSRIGLNNVWDGLFFALTVGAAWYAWERENRNAFLLAGVGLGLSQYFYPSSRVLMAVVYGGIILTGLFNFPRLKRSIPNLILMTLAAFIILLPLGWYYFKYPEQFFAPLQRVSVLGTWLENEIKLTGLPAWQILLKQIKLGTQAFTYLPLQHWYRPEVALLRPFFAGVFLIGLIHLLARPKDGRSITLMIWLVMYVLLGGLSESTPAAQRYVAAAPVCILVIAHGLNEAASHVERLWQRSRRALTVTVTGIAILMAASDIYFYFFQYTPKTVEDFGRNNGMIAQAIADEIINEPEGTQAFFFVRGDMGYYSIPSIPYLAPQVEGYDVFQPWGSPENPIPTANNLLFIFLPDGADDLPAVQETYPGGTLHEEKNSNGETLYLLYRYNAFQ